MEPLNHKEEQKTEALEQAVFKCSPEEITELYKKRKKANYTARALGFACRYRGLDMVKALVETGASFTHFTIRLRNANGYIQGNSELDYSEALLRSSPLLKKDGFYEIAEKAGLKAVPIKERVRIFDYLCGIADKVNLKMQAFMFWASLSYNPEMMEILKNRGVSLDDDMVEVIISEYHALFEVFSRVIPDEDFIPYVTLLNSVLHGKKVIAKFYGALDRLVASNSVELIDFIFKNFDFSSKRQVDKLIKGLIETNDAEKLALAVENGLFDDLDFLSEMIKYSAEKGSAGCTACLMDFKNRRFDLAAELAEKEKELTLDETEK